MYFNPRSREGSDMFGHGFKPVEIISIHAPVKGATTPPNGSRQSVPDFNPRSREGSDA